MWRIWTSSAFRLDARAASSQSSMAQGHGGSGSIRLAVTGEVKQDADIGDLIWNCSEQIAYIRRFERSLPGDLIYTGTPAGAGAVKPGDVIEVTIAGLEPLRVTIGEKEAAFA